MVVNNVVVMFNYIPSIILYNKRLQWRRLKKFMLLRNRYQTLSISPPNLHR